MVIPNNMKDLEDKRTDNDRLSSSNKLQMVPNIKFIMVFFAHHIKKKVITHQRYFRIVTCRSLHSVETNKRCNVFFRGNNVH